MKIVVCVKRVPDTAAQIKIADGTTGIDPAGIEFKLNPYDEFAVEQAVQIKEAGGDHEVVVVSLGPADSQKVLRTALAMGADRGVHLKTDAEVDAWQTASALAAEVKEVGADLVLFGKQAADNDQHQVGVLTAQLLGLASVSVVNKFELGDGSVKVARQIEGGSEVVDLALPAVVTCTKGLNEPRFTSLKGIMAAKKKTIDEKEPQLPEAALTVTGLSYPPERPEGRIVGEGAEAVGELVRLLQDEAKAL
jgi:electron transfer flavoprotein beta subunit